MSAKPYPPIGSPEEMRKREELRARLQARAADLCSEQLEKLVADARLMRLTGYPLPRDPATLAALLEIAPDERQKSIDCVSPTTLERYRGARETLQGEHGDPR